MRTLTGDDGGDGDAHGQGTHSLGPNHDLGHGRSHARDRGGAPISFWPDVKVLPRGKIDPAMAAPDGYGGGGCRRCLTTEESVSAIKQKATKSC